MRDASRTAQRPLLPFECGTLKESIDAELDFYTVVNPLCNTAGRQQHRRIYGTHLVRGRDTLDSLLPSSLLLPFPFKLALVRVLPRLVPRLSKHGALVGAKLAGGSSVRPAGRPDGRV